MSWIAWIALGGLAGWMSGRSTINKTWMNVFWNIIVGITGALAASWILGSLGVTEPLAFSIIATLVAAGGAMMSLFLFSLIRGRYRT